MIVKLKQDLTKKDIEVLITYPYRSKTVDRIVSLLESASIKIECYSDSGEKKVTFSDIDYIESDGKAARVYCGKESYKTKYRLFQLYDKLKEKGFVQISKYCIMNINKLDTVKPLFNSRMEAILSNGKRLYVTRKYLSGIRLKLQEDEYSLTN